MKKVDIVSKIVGRNGGGTRVPSASTASASVDLSGYLKKEVWDDVWEVRETDEGTRYVLGKLPMVLLYGMTMYAEDESLNLPGIYDGLPIDGETIYWEETDTGKVLKSKGGGEGTLAGIEITGEGNAITDITPSSDGTKLVFSKGLTFVDKSYLDENFHTKTYIADTFYTKQYIDDVFFKKDDATDLFVTLDETEQEILGIKVFKEGIKIGNSSIHQSQDGVLFLDGHLVVSGSVTMYGDNGDIDIPTIWAGLPIDENTLVRNEEGVLMVNPNIELGGASSWDDITGKPEWITDTKPSYTYSEISGTPDLSVYASKDDLKGYVSLTGTESVEGIKDFVNGIAIDGLSIYKSQDDVVYVDANLVVRGAVVMYGDAIADIPSFMESLLLDENTLTLNEEGRLTVIGGTGGGSIEYPLSWSGYSSGSYDGTEAKNFYIPSKVSELTNDSSFITSSALSGYATETWVNGKGFITSSALNGYATESYVTSRGYITSSSLSGYATESWVNGKGYLTSSSLSGYATQSWVTGQGYATSAALGAYLPLTGGTLTGTGNDLFTINRTMNESSVIRYMINGEIKGYIGISSAGKPLYVLADRSAAYVLLTKLDTGAGSGLDADMLDGLHVCGFGSGYGVTRSWTSGTYNSANQYFGNGNVVVIDPQGTGCLSSCDTILSLGKSGNRCTQLLFPFNNNRFYYRRTISSDYGSASYGGWHPVAVCEQSGNLYLQSTTNRCLTMKYTGSRNLGAYVVYRAANQNAKEWWAGGSGAYNFTWEYTTNGGSTLSKKMNLDISGNLLAYGGVTQYSDIRKKTVINHVQLSLREIADAPLIEHYYNSDERKTTHVGSIAQYWAGLNDWFCKQDDEGYYTMEIQNAALASAISVARELLKYETKTDKQIRRLKKRISELEEEIEKLKTA